MDAPSLDSENLRARIRDYVALEHSSFATIVIANTMPGSDLKAKLDATLPRVFRRTEPYFYLVEARQKFSDIVGQALNALKLAVVRDPQALNAINDQSEFQSLPVVNGPGALLAVG